MTRESELMLYVLLGIPVAVGALFLLFLGPIGWFLAAFLGVAALAVTSMFRGSGETGDAGSSRVNCPHCGARTAVGGDCDYCGDPL